MITIPESIKSLLKSDSVYKNFRVHFPNGEREDITNANIVSESVTLTESICSSQQLKIGMCETPSIEFETIGVPYIKGAEIECSLEVECPSTVDGCEYKSDIQKYVYPIPYGTFIVDSCKKQADMTHRRIIAYNKIAYKSWQLDNQTTRLMKDSFYWSAPNLKINIDGLIKLTSPDWSADYQETTSAFPDRYVYDFSGTGNPYGYVLWFEFRKYELDERHPIHNYKIEYPSAYEEVCEQITDAVMEVNPNALNNVAHQNFIRPHWLHYEHYDGTTNDYKLTLPETGPNTYIDTWEYATKSGHYCFTDLTLFSGDADTSHWETWGATELDISTSSITINPCVVVYERIIFGRRTENEGEIRIILATDPSDKPTVYIDDNAKDFELFDASNNPVSIPLSFKKKTNVVMNKYMYSSGSTSTVRKTLYIYDWASILSLDLKSIIQAYCEIQGKFGLITRDGNINFVSVNEAFNSPDDTISKSDYYTLWYDDFPSKPYGRISASYKDSNGDEIYTSYDLVENFSDADYKTYDISNNYFIKNYVYTEQQIQTIFQTMAANMTNISYMPMNLSMKGRPDLEAGDVVIVNSDEQQITGFIMQRTITGIVGLTDEITSQDDTDQSLLSSLNTIYDEETGTLSLYLSETRR